MKSVNLSRFKELDFIRGFASCWVMGSHFWYVNFLPLFLGYKTFNEYISAIGPSYSLTKFLPLHSVSLDTIIFDSLNICFLLGYQGVHLFFALSGFGLTFSRLSKPNEKWSNFFIKKFFRLYPTYWVLLVIALTIPWTRAELFYGFFDASALRRSFILLDKAIPYSWFMFPLIQFYLAFPLLFRLLKRSSIKFFLSFVFLLKFSYTLTILFLSYNFFPNLLGDNAYPGYLAISRMFEFCLGMTMAKAYFDDPKRLISYLSQPKIISLAIISELAGVLGTFKFANEIIFFGYVFPFGVSVYDALIGFGVFVLVFNLARLGIYVSNSLTAFLNTASSISYELYLTQFIPLLIFKTLFGFPIKNESISVTISRAVSLYVLIVSLGLISAFSLKKLTAIVVNQIVFAFQKFRILLGWIWQI